MTERPRGTDKEAYHQATAGVAAMRNLPRLRPAGLVGSLCMPPPRAPGRSAPVGDPEVPRERA